MHKTLVAFKMPKQLNVNVKYESSATIIISTRSEFLAKVSELYKIPEGDIEIYDRDGGNVIDVRNLEDLKRVEVKRKNHTNMARHNGATISRKTPNHDEIIRKLTENSVLTGIEREYLVELLSNTGSTNIPQAAVSNNTVMKSVKLQVYSRNLIPVIDTECQTDQIITPSPSKRHLDINDLIYQSKRLASAEKVDTNKAKELNDKTFYDRRDYILKQTPLAALVKEKYPLLFSLSEVQNEIDRIFHPGKAEQFLKNIEKYAKPILSVVREDDPLLLTTKRKVTSYPTKIQQKYAEQVGSLLMISSLMNEERGYLNLIDQPIAKSLFPYIDVQAKFNEIFFDEHLFQIYVEEILLCEASNFKEAILCLMGSYYIFNIKYQDEFSSSYTAFEQLYLERKDTSDIDECVEQIIGTIRLKAPSSVKS